MDAFTAILIGAASAVVVGWVIRNWLARRLDDQFAAQAMALTRPLESEPARSACQSGHERASQTSQPPPAGGVLERAACILESAHRDLVELHAILDALQRAADTATHGKSLQLTVHFNRQWLPFITFFAQNRIYFPKNTAQRIEAFAATLTSFAGSQNRLLTAESGNVLNPGDLDQMYKRVSSLIQQVPGLLEALEDDFQRMLFLEASGRGSRPGEVH